jgi:hypothetical protein
MNLAALIHIVGNSPELIENNVPAGVDTATTLGVARRLIGLGGDVDALTHNQRHHYDSYIRSLVENVACDGVFGFDPDTGHDTCAGNGRIDDEDLEGCYVLDEMLCQVCQGVANRMQAD